MTCYCGETNGTHKLHCDSMTGDGLCVVPWCGKRWDHSGGCDDMPTSSDIRGGERG